jgi:hypothetical protein
MKTLTLTIALALSAGMAISDTVHAAAESATTNVIVQSTKSVAEMSEYVEDVDRRLQKGRYDVIEDKERKWMISQIAELRAALQSADVNASPAPALVTLASEFETGMIKIEEGGIVCRQERKTGTRMATQRCFTRKRLQEDTQRSQDQLRAMPRPQMPVAPGPQ